MFKTGRIWDFMLPRVFFMPDGGNGAGDGGAEGADGAAAPPAGGTDAGAAGDANEGIDAEIARLKAEMAKQKTALDNATREASAYKKQLRARQSAEEVAAEEAKAQEEARNSELAALRKQFAVMESSKNIAVKLGGNDEASTKIAEYLYGAEDAGAVIDEFQKILTAREKALRLEFGRIPAPGAGGANGEDETMTRALELARKMGQDRARNEKSVREGLSGYIR